MKAILFDLDDTLVSRQIAFEKFCEYLIDKYLPSLPAPRTEIIAYMIAADGRGYRGADRFFNEIIDRWGFKTNPEQMMEERFAVFPEFTTPMPGMHEVLESLAARYPLGMITNGSSNLQQSKIDRAGIRHYFSTIIVSGEVGMRKPDSRIFWLCCQQMGLDPSQTAYVGDNPLNDIEGSLSAGLRPYWLDRSDAPTPEHVIRLKQLTDLLPLFCK